MITDELADDLKATNPKVAVFLRIGTDPVGRFWIGGIGAFPVPAEGIETTGGDYLGLGEALGLPAFESLVNGQAQRLSLTLSGLPERMVALAKAEASELRGAPVSIGIMGLDEDFVQSSRLYWLWSGASDTVQIARRWVGEGNYSRNVTIGMGNAETTRRRPLLRLFTDAFQKMRSATDRFCERTPDMSLGKTVKWPR